VQDLSHLLPGDPVSALAPTSQSGGNVAHDNRAMTAPGGVPATAEAEVHSAPQIEAQAHQVSVLPEMRGKPSIRLGETNYL